MIDSLTFFWSKISLIWTIQKPSRISSSHKLVIFMHDPFINHIGIDQIFPIIRWSRQRLLPFIRIKKSIVISIVVIRLPAGRQILFAHGSLVDNCRKEGSLAVAVQLLVGDVHFCFYSFFLVGGQFREIVAFQDLWFCCVLGHQPLV